MNSNDQDARNRIIKAVTEIFDEDGDIGKITVRKVAERANVGVGLINYHFKTKDDLLGIAIGDLMVKMASGFVTPGNSDLEPIPKLKKMLKELYGFAEKYEKLLQFTITHGLLNGDLKAPLFLVPVLREIFGGRKDEINLRIIALQIILPIQVTSLCPPAFLFYSGIDLRNESQRNNFIDTLVDNLVKQ